MMFCQIKSSQIKIQFITLVVKMFKSNLSPLNPTKDKYVNDIFIQHNNNQAHHTQNNIPSNYQYTKSLYSGNGVNHNKHESGSTVNYHNPLSTLSPNVRKNPMSPTAKIKMFSNTLNMNKKFMGNINQNIREDHQISQDNSTYENKFLGKIGPKNKIFDLTQSIDLKCDEVLEDSQLQINYRKQTPQNTYKRQTGYGKRTKSNNPIIKNENQINDDLKCDQVLHINKIDSHQDRDSKRNMKFALNYHNQSLADSQGNYTYINQMGRNVMVRGQNAQKPLSQGPLTPNYQRKKATPLIMTKRQTECQSQGDNVSDPKVQNATHYQQKSRSFSNVLSPRKRETKLKGQLNNQEQNQQIPEVKLENRCFEELKSYLQRTTTLLQTYRKKLDQVEQKNVFLQKQNVQLRKCVINDEGLNLANTHYHNTSGATRYQGMK